MADIPAALKLIKEAARSAYLSGDSVMYGRLLDAERALQNPAAPLVQGSSGSVGRAAPAVGGVSGTDVHAGVHSEYSACSQNGDETQRGPENAKP